MRLTPARAFALGVASVLLIAGTFVAGIGVGARDSGQDAERSADVATRVECPSPPGFTATKAEHERLTNCEAARSVRGMLLAAGATDADVQVTQEANGTLLGPETSMNVVATLDLPKRLRETWDADGMRAAISRALGTTPDRVILMDEQLVTLGTPLPAAMPAAAVAPRPGPIAVPASRVPALPAPGPRRTR